MTVAVCTPWVDHLEFVEDYFHAIERGPAPDELIIVDDGSFQPLDFAAVRHEETKGFSAACNAGLAHATADVVVFLNNDISDGNAGWLDKLEREAELGVLVGARLWSLPHADVDNQPMPYLDGWCLGGQREDLLELAGFDEEYQEPAYFSDNDLCLRARVNGMTLREVPTGLRHKKNGTIGPGNQPNVKAAHAANQKRYANRARELLGKATA
jgi:GT2 family glycosyltransferase